MAHLKLIEYPEANASVRIRVILHLKGLPYDVVPAERGTEFLREMNPQAMVPVLVDGPRAICQSLAIAEYLEESFPASPLLPAGVYERSRVRALAQIVACEGQPLANRRVREWLASRWGFGTRAVGAWSRHWVGLSLAEYESALLRHGPRTRFSHGDSPTVADAFLFAQGLLARRFGVDMGPFPRVRHILASCVRLPAFAREDARDIYNATSCPRQDMMSP
jgi:maleylacetoacetate isomerase